MQQDLLLWEIYQIEMIADQSESNYRQNYADWKKYP